MARPVIRQIADNVSRMQLPVNVGDTTNLERGDMLNWTTDEVNLYDTEADDTIFIGYAINEISATLVGTPSEVVVGLRGIVEYDSTSATYTPGQDLKYASENAVANADANAIMFSNEYGTTMTRLDCYVDVYVLGKLFTVTA